MHFFRAWLKKGDFKYGNHLIFFHLTSFTSGMTINDLGHGGGGRGNRGKKNILEVLLQGKN